MSDYLRLFSNVMVVWRGSDRSKTTLWGKYFRTNPHDTNNHHYGEFYQYRCHWECHSLLCLHLISGIREAIENKYHLRGKIIKNTPFLQVYCNGVISEIISWCCLFLSSLVWYQLSRPSSKVPRTVFLFTVGSLVFQDRLPTNYLCRWCRSGCSHHLRNITVALDGAGD